MKKVLFIVLGAIILLGCQSEKKDMNAEIENLKATDRAFSKMSVEKGALYAFHFYMAEDGKALPMKGFPRTKSDYARMLDEQPPDSVKNVFTWEPLEAEVAASGDFGVTFGKYIFTSETAEGVKQSEGNYITVWQKQKDGQWRFIYDSGNEHPSGDKKDSTE